MERIREFLFLLSVPFRLLGVLLFQILPMVARNEKQFRKLKVFQSVLDSMNEQELDSLREYLDSKSLNGKA